MEGQRGPRVAAGEGSLLADPRVTSGRSISLSTTGPDRPVDTQSQHALPDPCLCDGNYRTNQDWPPLTELGVPFRSRSLWEVQALADPLTSFQIPPPGPLSWS